MCFKVKCGVKLVVSFPRVSRCVHRRRAARGAPRELSAVCPRSVCVVFAAQLRCAHGARAPVSCTLLARGRWLVRVRAQALRAASDVRARLCS